MKSEDTQTAQVQPGLISALRAGFETVANHLSLVLFPVALDLLIWLGPHYRIKSLIEAISQDVLLTMSQGGSDTAQAAQLSKEFWDFAAERLNLATFLRSFPVGIPSLMAGRSPILRPGGEPAWVELASPIAALMFGLGFTLIGLIIGTFYYNVTAQAALAGKVNWLTALKSWPWSTLQVFGLAIFWVVLLAVVSIPSGCVMVFMIFGNAVMGQLALFIYLGFMLWLLLPLFFSAHGIILYRLKVKESILRSVQITRWSLPMTGLFFLGTVLITQGLDVVWNWPAEDTWMMLIGLGGHGLITTALLAASFVYYRQADLAIQKRLGLIST